MTSLDILRNKKTYIKKSKYSKLITKQVEL